MDPNKEKNVGCAISQKKKKKSLKRLPNEASIYSAETTAIDLAMNIANHKASKFIIYTDSKSVLLALHNRDTSSPLITKLLNKLNTLSKNNNIIFTWIPSHIGLQRNEKADKAAKKALQIDMCKSKIPDLKPTIKKFISDKWQKSWDNQTQNKLHEIQESIGEWPTGYRSIRREEVILARLRIGHTHITHSHLLKGEDVPVCPTCKVQLTTKHILLNCNNLKHIRTKYYQARNLRDIFKNTNPENIFNWGDERGCDEGHWHTHTRRLQWGLPEVVWMVQQVHCSRRRILWRELEFHVCTINKSAHTKKVWKLI